MAQLMGENKDFSTNQYHLRNKILKIIPELSLKIKGSDYVLTDEGQHNMKKQDEDCSDFIAFERLVKKVRKEIRDHSINFEGTFSSKCQQNAVPAGLLAMVSTMLYGNNDYTYCEATQPALTIAQLIMFNQKDSNPKGGYVTQQVNSEPPLPIYNALSSYNHTRSKAAIDEMGISISYKRVKSITSNLCSLVIKTGEEEGLFCPRNLKKGIFTMGAYDNIDHNPSSTTAKESFHGTSMSIFQTPTESNLGVARKFSSSFSNIHNLNKGALDLPGCFSEVTNIVLSSKHPKYPPYIALPPVGSNQDTWKIESEWLNHITDKLTNESETSLDITWAGFHATKQININITPNIGSLLPLFHERSTDISLICHGIEVIKNITKYLNGDQTPVIFVDQPLYTMVKLAQWNWPNKYGSVVAMFAPFHIEQAFLRILGELLDQSGWCKLMADSEICTIGVADAALKVLLLLLFF